MSDNLHIDVIGEDEDDLADALRIALRRYNGRVAGCYSIDHETGETVNEFMSNTPTRPTLVFSWCLEEKIPAAGKLVSCLTMHQPAVTALIEDWLAGLPWNAEPDIDGECSKGWRIFTEGWGHVGGDHYAAFAVQPVWMMHGK